MIIDIENAKRKWKPIFDYTIKKHPNVTENEIAILCEKISNNSPTFEYYYEYDNPNFELARLRLKEAPNLPLMMQISSELGIFEYNKAYKYYCDIIDIFPVEKFFNYEHYSDKIIQYVRKIKLLKIEKITH